jgi:hypothetical protein
VYMSVGQNVRTSWLVTWKSLLQTQLNVLKFLRKMFLKNEDLKKTVTIWWLSLLYFVTTATCPARGHHDTQHNDNKHNHTQHIIMLNITHAECLNSSHCAECRYAERRYSECRGAVRQYFIEVRK